ncbi:hypothetical protein [Billgrantia endophytica]|uniref:Uncharacterized protein n=1 Tax=Billgrantia endophytica TaxID=2033802 RepID=A0A2N7U060_9GAMM|nr:hypothetical protein [Halomonas endophytica]PMR73824.1 hypothetical protein C1H69_15985 [Halomonas endophytica]
MSIAWPTVPSRYCGVWQRTLYAEPAAPPHGVRDTTSRVVWLQTASWHADLRLTVERPDFNGISGLDGCNREQLLWLADLTAFAGLTQVDASFETPPGGESCTWHRVADLLPSLERDSGIMHFDGDNTLEERHPSGRYLERWERLANGNRDEHLAFDAQGRPVWLQLGDHAVAIAHRPPGADAATLYTHLKDLNDAALRWRAGLRFDYLRRDAESWRVALSTHPWRVGLCLPSPVAD